MDNDQLAKWLDPTPLTLEVLTAELGPASPRSELSFQYGRMLWEEQTIRVSVAQVPGPIFSGPIVVYDGKDSRQIVKTLGQLRRVLSVLREVHG